MLERGIRFENVCLGERRPSALIQRYGNLYAQARVDTLDALDGLSQLRNSDELKSKLLFSVVVVSRKVHSLHVTSLISAFNFLTHLLLSSLSYLSWHFVR